MGLKHEFGLKRIDEFPPETAARPGAGLRQAGWPAHGPLAWYSESVGPPDPARGCPELAKRALLAETGVHVSQHRAWQGSGRWAGAGIGFYSGSALRASAFGNTARCAAVASRTSIVPQLDSGVGGAVEST